MALAPQTTPTMRTLTLPQRRLLDTWRLRVGSCYSTFADVFESELDTADNHEWARLIGITRRLIASGALVADSTRKPEHRRKYRAVA